jgi:hypothetical protein
MNIKNIICLLLPCLFQACTNDSLGPQSVVDAGSVQNPQTELDRWIADSITAPYNIEVVYRWQKNANTGTTFVSPPKPDNVKAILRAVRELCFETYRQESLGGTHFLQGKTPLRLYLYGGKNVDENGVELLNNPLLTPSEMCIFRVDDFKAGDADKMYALMRSVHHQFARRLAELVAYDRDRFTAISGHRYTGSTESLAAPLGYSKKEKDYFGLADYANKRGFYTMQAFLSAEDDFAEIISSTLCATPKEVNDAINTAQTPDQDSDPEVQQQYNKEAEQAYKEIVAKQAFVEQYMQKSLHINFKQLQIASLRRINNYIKQHAQ